MKYLVILITLCFLILSTGISQAQWTSTNFFPNSKNVYNFAFSGDNFFAGTDSGVFLSTNNGMDWSLVNNGLPAQPCVYALASIGDNIYSGTKAGVFLSTNNGTNWTNIGLTNYSVYLVAVKGNNIFAATGSYGLFRSTDNGTNWTPINNGLIANYVNCLTVSGDSLFTSVFGYYNWSAYGDAYISTNNGDNWTPLYAIGRSGLDVTAIAMIDSSLFLGIQPYYEVGFLRIPGGVYILHNTIYGRVWDGIFKDLTIGSVFSFAASGTNLFAGTNTGVFLSLNNGSNLVSVNTGMMGAFSIYSLVVNGNYIFAGTNGAGIWRRPLSELTGVTKEVNDLPKDFTLSQNYPNPFNPTTVISYSLPSSSNIKLVVYNTLGQTIKVLESGYKNAGNYSVNFNASDLPSGIYFYKLEAGQFSQIKKMILIK
jgi:photosystem II stability/assembly factor-like uncharacterized protein